MNNIIQHQITHKGVVVIININVNRISIRVTEKYFTIFSSRVNIIQNLTLINNKIIQYGNFHHDCICFIQISSKWISQNPPFVGHKSKLLINLDSKLSQKEGICGLLSFLASCTEKGFKSFLEKN